MKPMKFGIGQPVRRVEDQRFVTGAGRYTADVMPDGRLVGYFLRSPHANARIARIDVDAARKAPGVKLVLTAADLGHLASLPCLAPMPNADGQQMATPEYPLLARDRVRHVGDAVAMIVADSEAAARESDLLAFEIAIERTCILSWGSASESARAMARAGSLPAMFDMTAITAFCRIPGCLMPIARFQAPCGSDSA